MAPDSKPTAHQAFWRYLERNGFTPSWLPISENPTLAELRDHGFDALDQVELAAYLLEELDCSQLRYDGPDEWTDAAETLYGYLGPTPEPLGF
jgi:hypothetical protein